MTKRYSDREVGLILQRALEPRHIGDDPHDASGLSLEQIKEIAAEVGIPADRVDAAAATLLEPEAAKPNLYAGIPTTVQFQTSVDGIEIEAIERPELLTIIRGVLGRQGRASAEFGSLEWQAKDPTGARYVSVMPTKDGVRVRVMGNFRDGLIMSVLPLGMICVTIAGMLMDGSGLSGPAIFGIAAAAFLIPPRFVYRWWRKREDSKLRELHRKVVAWLGSGTTGRSDDGRTLQPGSAASLEEDSAR